jgi:hypothetical protein
LDQKALPMIRWPLVTPSYHSPPLLSVIGEVAVGPGGLEMALADPRVKAAVAMSAPVVGDRKKLDQAFGKITIPCMHMTGTLDDSPIGETKAKERRLPFDYIHKADQYLIIFTGGDHMIFSGRGRLLGGGKDTVFQDLIRSATTAFWDAYLKDVKPAKVFQGRSHRRQRRSRFRKPRLRRILRYPVPWTRLCRAGAVHRPKSRRQANRRVLQGADLSRLRRRANPSAGQGVQRGDDGCGVGRRANETCAGFSR